RHGQGRAPAPARRRRGHRDPALVTRALLNPSPATARGAVPGGGEVLAFHRGLPGYAQTPLRALPSEAAALGLGALRLKDENGRFVLPAFKISGESWALERVLAEQPGLRMVWAASEGNHGRAVARAAAQRGRAARGTVASRRDSPFPPQGAGGGRMRSPPRARRSCASTVTTSRPSRPPPR